MNNAVFRKTMENVRNHRDIKVIISEAKQNYLVSEPSYYKTKNFSQSWSAKDSLGENHKDSSKQHINLKITAKI